ncbi:MAG: right-handed parallel beta-helix repeat-containing protein [Sedimentisphaerales bacterium]|nr:right-handed parallel beta-helix repeat-containing protein [Sedimentisphaerales bacterium]
MKKAILLGLTLFLAIGTIVHAETRLVPGDYPSIQLAIRESNDGDIIIVNPGTYYETVNFSGKNIILTSTNPNDPDIVAETIIDADGDGSTVTFENGETSEAVLTGFTITGGFGTSNDSLSPGTRILWGAGIYCAGSSPTITNNILVGNNAPNEIFGDFEDAILGYGGAIGGVVASPIISRNIIKDNTAYAGAGIFVIGDPVISNNLIYSNSAYIGGGVIMFGGSLINNTVAGNDASLDGGAQFGGNIYIAFGAEEIGGSQSRVLNNIIVGAESGGGIVWEGDFEEGVIQFNNVWGNTPGNYGAFGTNDFIYDGQIDQTGIYGNISHDPLFVDAENDNYHLQTDSPCVNAGDPGVAPVAGEADIDGEYRTYAYRIDIGADEYVGYVKPVAYAGPDLHVDIPQPITLDGGGSFFYDPNGMMEFSWEQVGGSPVEMSDFAGRQITVNPESEGEYRFVLVVGDGVSISEPDEILVIVRNRPPVADAGPDQSTITIPSLVTLDGGASYDLGGVDLSYRWNQVSGPAVTLSDSNVDTPTFVPSQMGIYVFELVVNDGQIDSEPDIVGIVIGSRTPIADAGQTRYAASEPVYLDGGSSFDPDGYGNLTFQWRQVSGPPVEITGENTGMPMISGFSQTNEIQRCEFELLISDGVLDSRPERVQLMIVPYFGSNPFRQLNAPFDPNKPTIVVFGDGDCVTGSGISFSEPDTWYETINYLTVNYYGSPYDIYADAFITYLSNLAPDYSQPIQTVGFGTGAMPAMDIAVRLNGAYADARYAINRVSLLDATCRDYSDDIAKLASGSIDGESCWIDNYYATSGTFYPGTLNIRFPAPEASHYSPLEWFQSSYTSGGGARSRPIYNDGITAGYYCSVAGPGKNLQLSSGIGNYYFEWNSRNNTLRYHNESLYSARIPEAVKLVGPEDGTFVGANGVVLSCETNDKAVSYQLLFGSTAHNLTYLVSDTPNPPEDVIKEFPFETTFWTVRVKDEYGTTIYADPVSIESDNVTPKTIENITTGGRYDSIQNAINKAMNGDEIVVEPGIYPYFGGINFKGKAITVRSTDPDDPGVVAATIIIGDGHSPVVTFSGSEGANSVLAGFTISGGNRGICCSAASPVIKNCNVIGNINAGLELHKGSNPTIINCDITANIGSGLVMIEIETERNIVYNRPVVGNCIIAQNYEHGVIGGIPTITNCTIVSNKQAGISDSRPTVANSIIYHNGIESDFVQMEDIVTGTVTYTDVQGGWPGQGNIDADPLFADLDNADYHLKSQSGHWDSVGRRWIVDDVTSPCIDAGDPSSPVGLELPPNGGIINMGIYGGTPQASKSVENGE